MTRIHIRGLERDDTAMKYARLYDGGDSIRDIAASTGRPYSSVRRLLLHAGVRLRPPGTPSFNRPAA